MAQQRSADMLLADRVLQPTGEKANPRAGSVEPPGHQVHNALHSYDVAAVGTTVGFELPFALQNSGYFIHSSRCLDYTSAVVKTFHLSQGKGICLRLLPTYPPQYFLRKRSSGDCALSTNILMHFFETGTRPGARRYSKALKIQLSRHKLYAASSCIGRRHHVGCSLFSPTRVVECCAPN